MSDHEPTKPKKRDHSLQGVKAKDYLAELKQEFEKSGISVTIRQTSSPEAIITGNTIPSSMSDTQKPPEVNEQQE